MFLIEAERTFLRWMPRSNRPFWGFYRNSLRGTNSAILRVDELQQSPRTHPQKLFIEYPKVNSVLKVGSAAICMRFNRLRSLRRIERCMDNLAAGSQILDDLSDLAEDFQRSRFNYVALKLLRNENRVTRRRNMSLADISRQMLYSSTGEKVLGEVIDAFASAYRALDPLRIREASRIARFHHAALVSLRERMLVRRAEVIFGTWKQQALA